MKTQKTKNAIVQSLVHNIALVCLAETEYEPAIRKAASAHRTKLLTSLTAAELKPILMMRNVMIKLAQHLASCESIEALQASEHLMEELIAGRVVIVDDATGEALQAHVNQLANGSDKR